MELKEGMYIRTKYNDFCGTVAIRKIDEIDDDGSFWIDDYIIDTFGDKQNKLHEEDIELASENIVDVIKPGDYVNGYKVLEICTGNFELNNPLNVKALKLEFIKEDINPNIPFFKRYNFITNSEIKSIITKEQFALMEYEVK